MTAPRLTRRQLLAGTGAGFALAATGLSAPARAADTTTTTWTNWSGWQVAKPANVFYPASEAELVNIVKTARTPIRAFGGGHSFSPVVPSNGTLVSLEPMAGLVSHDAATLRATLGGGTRIMMAGGLLAGVGQNLQNEPDINMQSLAGAISTATHGTGASLQCLSGYVTQLKLVLADGSVVTCSKDQDAELFEAARVGVGSIGIITEITFQNRAAYSLAEETKVMDFEDACTFITQRKNIDRHVEFMAFAHGGKAIVKQMNFTTEAETPAPESMFDENELLDFAANTARVAPFSKGLIQRLVGTFVTQGHRAGPAHRMFPSPRLVQFNEMEYTVPAEKGLDCLREVVDVIRKKDINVFFPIEFRYVAADDTWMSMFSGRAGASISVHQYHKQDYRELFNAVEPVFRKYAGRPHWGKLNTLVAKDIAALYPRFEDYRRVRARVDPQGRFLTPYMRSLLGVPA